ncbi:protein cramped-like isoform X2 [Ambystoma mexicanum]
MTVKLGQDEAATKLLGKRCSAAVLGEETPEEEDVAPREAPLEGEQDFKSSVQPSPDQRHFLRSSVRSHSKRQRKDPAPTAGGSGTRSKDNGGSSSGCPSTISLCSASIGGSKTSRTLCSSASEKEDGIKKKVRRQWESWSTEDKNTFFEGLYEHGKDFEAIKNNIALKYKKKGKPASMVKNKEQVRHFYYRTWHKISKYIDFDKVFSQDLKKSSQELYGLICYGELRKKIGGCMDEKNAPKLNELIQLGATTLRHKGRNVRIKAPMCRALKKLCDPDGVSDEEDQKPVRLPLKVPVELQPRNNHAWARVQSLAQNPRLRMMVELHRKVSSLIEFLKQKWALHETRVRKTLKDQHLQYNRDLEIQGEQPEEKLELHLFPGENCTITMLPGVARVVHSKAYCTVHWQEAGKCKPNIKESVVLPPAQMLGIQSGQGTARIHLRYPPCMAEGKDGGRTECDSEVCTTPMETSDATENIELNLPEPSPVEMETLHLGSPYPANTSLDLGESPASPNSAVSQTEGRKSPICSPPSAVKSSSRMSDQEELSLLDPFPRYMKSCHHLIIPEKCLCTDNLPILDGDYSATSASPVEPPPGINDSLILSSVSPAGSGATSPINVPSIYENQAVSYQDPEPGLCTKDLVDTNLDSSPEKQQYISLLSQEALAAKPPREDAVRFCEEGWNLHTSDNLTLAEVYLMLGKPGKLQLEYDWMVLTDSVFQETGEPVLEPVSFPRSTSLFKQRLLSCLLRLIATEVNPKMAPETHTVATSPIKTAQEEQTLTPPGKVNNPTSRSPGCSRNSAPFRGSKAFSPTSSSVSGLRNTSRSLLVSGVPGSGSNDSDGGLFAVPTTLPPNSRHGKLFSSSKDSEGDLQQHLDTISSDFFLPKQRKLRSRHMRKPLVVQRTLLPRPSGNTSPPAYSFSILPNSSVAGRGSFRPIQSSLSKSALSRPIVPKIAPASEHFSSAIDLAAKSAGILPLLETDDIAGIRPLSPDPHPSAVSGEESGINIETSTMATQKVQGNECTSPFITLSSHAQPDVQIVDGFQQVASVLSLSELPKASHQNGQTTPLHPSQVTTAHLSPPNVSALLDISLPGPPEEVLSHGEPTTHISDSIIEIAISSGQYGEGATLSPAKLNGSDSSKSLPSPSSSPHQNWIASPSHDPHWYPNDSTDSSLSSLFSSFISPEKNRKVLPTAPGNTSGTSLLGPSLLDGNSRDSFVSRSDVAEVVDSQLVCMMNENSVDYISRFNDLAHELSVTEPIRRDNLFDSPIAIQPLHQTDSANEKEKVTGPVMWENGL